MSYIYVFLYVKYPLYWSGFRKYDVSLYYLKSSNINFFETFQWQPFYSIRTDGWTDSLQETVTLFSGIFEVPNIVHFVLNVKYLQATDLLSAESKQQCLRMA